MSSTEPLQPGYGTCDGLSPQCPVEATIYGSLFSMPAMLFYTILFTLLFLTQTYLFLRHRTFTFSAFLLPGIIFDTMGHASRLAMHYNPWSMPLLSLQICGLLWGPTLVAASISIIFAKVVWYVGENKCVLRPTWIPWVFVGTDVFSILIQGVGGIVASVSSGEGEGQTLMGKVGDGMMIGGVVCQICGMLACVGVMGAFWWRVKKEGPAIEGRYEADKKVDEGMEKRFGWFVKAASVAFACVLVRCCYRVVEMAGGWANPIMRDETSFIVLDSTMIAVAVLLLTVFHPGIWFPVMRREKKTQRDAEAMVAKEKAANSSGSDDSRLDS